MQKRMPASSVGQITAVLKRYYYHRLVTCRDTFSAAFLAIMLATCSTPKLEFPTESTRPKVVDTPRIPFTDWMPNPSSRHEAQIRKIRDLSYNERSREYLFVGLGGTCFVDRVSIPRDFAGSSTVVLGTVTKTQSRLSEDQRNLYTEWTAKIEDVWKQAGLPDLAPGAELLINRIGGAMRMPSGKKFETTVDGISGPLYTERRYVLFLHYRPKQQWFDLEKAWQFQDGRMVAVDPEDSSSEWQGASLQAYQNAYKRFKVDYVANRDRNR